MDCEKKQRENYKGTPRTRCIHKESELYRQVVSDAQCAGCPVRIAPKEPSKPCLPSLPVVELPQNSPYPNCPFRYESNADGLKCSITNLPVTPEICQRCDAETREHEAKFGDKVKNYFGAVRRWIANGRPTRSPLEIEQLFEDHCKTCDRYDKERHACKNCGCTVSTDSEPLKNKLAMKTEHCPLGRF